MSKQTTLAKGEMLLTDGHITARTRCGNQVSVLPQANTSPHEPMMAEFERPDAVASGREEIFPETSAALNLDPMIPIAPPFGAYPQPTNFMPFPPAPIGTSKCSSSTTNNHSNCNPPNPPPPPPPAPVPEPGTLVLVASGALALYGRHRLGKG